MRRPLIGLPGRRKQVGNIEGMPASLGELHIDMYYADYARSVYRAGGMPVHLPIDADAADWVHHLDGLVLTGGADIEPGRYGHENTASETEPERDDVEFVLYETSLADELPVLGICRGFQLVNVHAGGTLHQHVEGHARYDVSPSTAVHTLAIETSSLARSLFGDDHRVNSLHHQAVDSVGDGLRVTARAEDGTPEALEHTDATVLAVQWHPEMMGHDDPAFTWVVEAALRRRS
ncbi:MAG: gamma-glutamyl-gamma-aminobutyrate hydrolase family protein, partial [Ilumatobacteraceae bacterium]